MARVRIDKTSIVPDLGSTPSLDFVDETELNRAPIDPASATSIPEFELRELARRAPRTKSKRKVSNTLAHRWSEATELVVFWTFIAGLAWVPFLYGSNVLVAWGVNALLFPGLAGAYEISLLARGKSHPVALKEFWVSAALFSVVVLWIIIQNATWVPSSWQHAIWAMAADALHRPVEGSISVNRDLTTLALLRLITAASAFWLAVQLCRNTARANYFINAIAAIACGYALYGLLSFASTSAPITWVGQTGIRGFVTSSFYNHDHYAAYAGIGLVTICGAILQFYRDELALVGGSLKLRIGMVIDATARKGVVLLGGAFLILVALALTGSRGGILATALGLLGLCVLWFGRNPQGLARQKRSLRSSAIFVVLPALALGISVILIFGDAFFGKIAGEGLHDDNRIAVYTITLRSIFDSPLFGYGYGTFADVFPMFRDRSIGTYGVWEQAHNTYLEIFQELGLVFGSMLLASVVLLVWKCLKGVISRRKGAMVCCVATAVALLVGAHALVDFSLQIQAVALTFMAILGAGVAQSKSSRLALHD
jgi:O-antigen ligase